MSTLKTRLTRHCTQHLDKVITAFGAMIALIIIMLEQGRINDDAVLYLEVAKYFSLFEWKTALSLYPWAFHSFLIGITSAITGLGLETSAYAWSVFFFGLTTYVYIRLIRLAGGSNKTVIAGTLLLFTNPYIIGDTLPMILRDQGFWAFFLLTIALFIRFYRRKTLGNHLAWQISAIVATLFRTEGLALVTLLPCILLAQKESSWKDRLKDFLLAYTILITGLVAGIIASINFSATPHIQNARALNIVLGFISGAYTQISEGLVTKAHMIGDEVLGKFLADYGMQGLLLTLIAIVVGKITGTAGWLAVLLAALQYKIKNVLIDLPAKIILWWAAFILFLTAMVSLLANFILAGRYIIPVALIIMIIAAFSLTAVYEQTREKTPGKRYKLLASLIVVVLLFNCWKTFKPKPEGYTYERDAVTWVLSHRPENTPVFYDNARLRYYAGLPLGIRGVDYWEVVERAIQDGSLTQHRLLVIHLEKEHPERADFLSSKFGYHAIKEFTSKNKHKIVVLEQDNSH
jgi:hypothetical protein